MVHPLVTRCASSPAVAQPSRRRAGVLQGRLLRRRGHEGHRPECLSVANKARGIREGKDRNCAMLESRAPLLLLSAKIQRRSVLPKAHPRAWSVDRAEAIPPLVEEAVVCSRLCCLRRLTERGIGAALVGKRTGSELHLPARQT